VLLAVRDGDEAVLIERLSPAGTTDENAYPVGNRMPLAGTGVGLALLAFAPEDFRAAYTQAGRQADPESAPVTPAVLRRHLARIRADGVATIARPTGPAYASVAAPVFGHRPEPAAAISVVAPPRVLAPSNVRAAVVAIAGTISRQLRSSGHVPLQPGTR
jgi:DNA-binding IclR family transcriptional regulator